MIAFVAALFLQVPVFNPASCPNLYWRDGRDGIHRICKTRKDLDEVIELHHHWLKSNGAEGRRADLHNADLSRDDLHGVDLWGAVFSDTILVGANFNSAILGPIHDNRQYANTPPGAWAPAPPMILSGTVTNSDGTTTTIGAPETDLQHALAFDVDFRHADLSFSNLSFAILNSSDLSDADLNSANLSHAALIGTKLDRADFSNTDLLDTVFEPASIAGISGIESANHLETLVYETNPSGLIELRKLLHDEGFRDQEREITYALNRKATELESPSERLFKRIAFDMTSQYGMNPGRCLRLIVVLWVASIFVFDFAIHRRGWMRLRVTRRFGCDERTREAYMWSQLNPGSRRLKKRLISIFRLEWRILRTSIFFSLVNAFSIGYREFAIGSWLLLFPIREYEIKPSKWARPLAGIQSLLTLYLFALWLLTYFGQPFE